MKAKTSRLYAAVLALCGAAFAQSALADRVPAAEAAALAAHTQEALAEGAVAANRAAAIDYLVNIWSGEFSSRETKEQFRATLNAATNKTLARVQAQTTIENVRRVLLGKAAVAVDANGALRLGDLGQDLVFTPNNPPCRIFDTRNQPGGLPPAGGTTKNYQVYGSGATMLAQGGNPAGCAAPKGEPVAISANFTIANPSGQGHIRVFPFGGVLPTVSFVNFLSTSGSVANSGIISTCYLCASDLSVYNAVTVHHIGDVMGYFYPVAADDPALNEVKASAATSGGTTASPLISDNAIRFIGPTLTFTIATGDKLHMVANQAVGTGSTANDLDVFPCYRPTSSTGTPSTQGGGIFGIAMTSSQRIPVGVSWVFSFLPADTYQFGMCYRTASTTWNNNEWGYVSAVLVNY